MRAHRHRARQVCGGVGGVMFKKKLSSERSRQLLRWLQKVFPREDFTSFDNMPMGVEIKLLKPTRTLKQNALYWAMVTAIAEYSGDTKEGVHLDVLCEIHGYDTIEFRGRVKRVPRGRSKDLNRKEFGEKCIEVCQRWIAEAQIPWRDEVA